MLARGAPYMRKSKHNIMQDHIQLLVGLATNYKNYAENNELDEGIHELRGQDGHDNYISIYIGSIDWDNVVF